jgi:hypothetical protein
MTSRASARSGRGARREGGQVLALLLMLLAALLGSLLFVFNSGQIVAAKLRLVGAADAAAYSAAQAQARALNFQAYMNRAIVANEVAIAQLVSLRSWSGYMDQVLQEASTVGSLVPPLAAPLRSLAHGWDSIDRGLQRALPPLEAAASVWNVEVLARAEFVADAQTAVLADAVARQVASDNLPELGAGAVGRAFMAGNALQWRNFTAGHGRRGDERARLREVVMDSRDGFSRARDWTLGLPPLLTLRKRGGTDLIGYDSWRGMDTLALRVSVLFGTHEQPLAWHAAENRRRPEPGRGEHGGSYRDNPRSSRYAARELLARNGYHGLPAYRDVRLGPNRSHAALRYDMELRQTAGTIATTDVIMGGAATVVPNENPKTAVPAYQSGAAYALSAAQVDFRRPVGRADHRPELGSLFNPYWQARLAPVTRSQRLVAAAADGGGADPYLVLP